MEPTQHHERYEDADEKTTTEAAASSNHYQQALEQPARADNKLCTLVRASLAYYNRQGSFGAVVRRTCCRSAQLAMTYTCGTTTQIGGQPTVLCALVRLVLALAVVAVMT